MTLAARFNDLTHGWHGFLLFYGLIAVFALAGLRRARASLHAYLYWPATSLATMVITGFAIAIMRWFGTALFDATTGGIGTDLLAALLIMAGGYAGGLWWGARSRPRIPEQGRGAVVTDGRAAQAASRALRGKALTHPDARFPVTVAGIAVPFDDEIKHFKLMGTTGSGKSSSLRELIHAALYRGDRAVIADPDGGYLSRFHDLKRGDVILNPFDRRSLKWNLFAELKNAYDVDQLARAFIPDRGNADPTWTSYARTFFSAVTRQAHTAGITDVSELYRLLTAATREELKMLLDGTPAAPFLEEGSEKLFGGVRSTTADHVKCLDYIRAQEGAPFSVREWIRSGQGVLFLPYQADQIPALRSIISTWMRLAIFQTMSLSEGDSRLWFVVDELDALGAIDGLPDALARLRKFGGRCALGFQSISQVSTTYGQGPAQAMVENCGNTLILRCSSSEGGGTARFASRLIGEREVKRLNYSVSRSSGAGLGSDRDTVGQSEQHATESAVLAAEIEQLPDRAGFLKFPSRPAWMRVSFDYYDIPKIAEPFIEG